MRYLLNAQSFCKIWEVLLVSYGLLNKTKEKGVKVMGSRLLVALGACVLILVATTTNAAVLPLEGRLPTTPGGTDYQAYYDPNLDITWAADTNINGLMSWADANAWAADLTIDGVGGWRLPNADVSGDGTVAS